MDKITRLEYVLVMAEWLSVSSEVDDEVRKSLCRHVKKVLREFYDERIGE